MYNVEKTVLDELFKSREENLCAISESDKEKIKRDMQSVKQIPIFKDDYDIDISTKQESKKQLSARERLMQMVGK